ncbi:MAG: YihY/virulence factor BrkB family protein [Desulfobacterales bacterium]|nr:YihY/virulence factor BrkB family protein [Desulfobacterales bacterium]
MIIKNILNTIDKLARFLKADIWRIRLGDLPRKKSFFIKPLRVILLAIRGFDEDKCHLRASALTFYSILSIVPLVAMAFGLSKGFGFEKVLERQLMEQFPVHQEVMTNVIQFARSFLDNTKGGLMAGTGLVVLFWTVIKLLGDLEHSLNEIWEIKESRKITRKFGDYFFIILICPLLVIVSSSMTVFVSTLFAAVAQRFSLVGVVLPMVSFILKFLPYFLIWILFTLIYILIPNTHVRFGSGMIAGVLAGTIFQLAQWFYILFQVGVSRYNAIYGSFAAIPLFLIWMQLSWLIVFLGAEISFAHQNVDTYEFEPDSQKINSSFKKLLALHVVHLLVKIFSVGGRPLTAGQISQELLIPIRTVRRILYDLVAGGILSETRTAAHKEFGYQPARDIGQLSVNSVIDVLEHLGTETLPVAQSEAFRRLSEALKTFRETVEKSPANLLIKDI